MPKPEQKRAIAFIDGQNLYFAVKNMFLYNFPNFDIQKLASSICERQGWKLLETRFYTGVPKESQSQFWYRFWKLKLLAMKRRKDMFVYYRDLRYLKKEIKNAAGEKRTITVADEKGIDVRIAIDTIRLAHKKKYDVALIFSQDQDLSEVADEIRDIAREQNRWIKVASAFPLNIEEKHTRRGINKTDWIAFDKELYDACLDPRDYRMKNSRK